MIRFGGGELVHGSEKHINRMDFKWPGNAPTAFGAAG